jgi:Na+-driven multidrug efflux pump
VTIVLDLILIPTFGVVGAAVASTVAYVWFGTVSLIVLSRIAGFPVRALAIPTRDDLASYPRAARDATRAAPPGGRKARGR